MVVFIHVLFYGAVGTAVDALARFAVPLFFLVSGYYSYKTTPDKIKRRIVHLIDLLVFAVLVYTCYYVLRHFLNKDVYGMCQYFKQYLNPKVLLKLFVLNIPVRTEHLWYLFAIIYVYLIFCFSIIHNISDKLIFAASVLFLLLHLFMGEVLSVFQIYVPIPLVRNFLLMGLPFFGLGIFTKKHQHKLRKLSDCKIIVFAIIGILETILSRYLFGKNELYIGSLFILFSLVVVFIKYPRIKIPPVFTALSDCSTYIYILHPLVSSVLKLVYPVFGAAYSSIVLQMLHPLIVCVFSTITAYILNKAIQRLRKPRMTSNL